VHNLTSRAFLLWVYTRAITLHTFFSRQKRYSHAFSISQQQEKCSRVLQLLALSAYVALSGTARVGFAQHSLTPTSPAHIFYTDLLSGPATGGETGEGAFVTLYGIGFGSSKATSKITIGGSEVYSYPVWTDTRVTIQLGRTARTGPLVAQIASGSTSNEMPFVVRAGRIYFVSPHGKDEQNGSFAHPWRTLVVAKNSLRPGDIAYAMDGVAEGTVEKYDAALSIERSGEAGAPLAIVAYPGAKVTLGSFDGPRIALRTPNIDRTSNHWVIAGFSFLGGQEALDLTASSDWRIIGNDFTCPKGFGPTGCVQTERATYVAFLGNTVHDVAQPGTTKAYHGVYFGTDSNHIDVGWNTIAYVRGCRGLQFHSSPLDKGTGNNQFDLHVHDNIIHDVVCDGINFATIDPSKGPVEAYNNLIYNAGTGPDPMDGGADYACIYVQGGAEYGVPGSGTVELYNNTLYDCGARGNTDSGGLSLSAGSPQQRVRIRNNIIVLRHNESLLTPNSTRAPLLSQTNMIWSESKPLTLSPQALGAGTLLKNPLFLDPAHVNFTPGRGSPAINTGTVVGLAWDLRGFPRPHGAKPDMGAIQNHPDDLK